MTANRFLREIDRERLRDRINTIYDYRAAQATAKSFKEVMRGFQAMERRLEAHEVREGGHRQNRNIPLAEDHKIWVDQRTSHVQLSDLSESEQAEIGAMWETVPEHLKPRAKELLGGH